MAPEDFNDSEFHQNIIDFFFVVEFNNIKYDIALKRTINKF